MPNQVGFVTDGPPHNLATYNFVQVVRDFVEANGHTVLRHTTVDDPTSGHELVVRSPGMSGTEQIFWGIRTYHSVGADYYNLLTMVSTGFVSGNVFDAQPNAVYAGVPAHNARIDYWLSLNGQRIVAGLKVGTPVYEHLYLGKFLPYARPSQYPYPVLCGGMLDGAAATRFSETTHDFYPRGGHNRGRVRTPTTWAQAFFWPWPRSSDRPQHLAGPAAFLRDTGGQYPLLPIIVHDGTANIWGELDGIYYVCGFGNAVENTLSIAGVNYVVMQSVARTGFADYYAMRLDQ